MMDDRDKRRSAMNVIEVANEDDDDDDVREETGKTVAADGTRFGGRSSASLMMYGIAEKPPACVTALLALQVFTLEKNNKHFIY